MSQYKISKKRLAEIIKEEYEAAINRTDEEEPMKKAAKDKKMKKESLDSIRALIRQELKNL